MAMKLLLLLPFFITVVNCIAGIGRTQSVAVKGQLICNGRPAARVKVKLYDDDRGVDTDDLMAESVSDAQGRFELRGHETEITTIDPKLNIYHDCNDEVVPCQKKVTIIIPDSYITGGKIPSKIFDAGTLNLAGKFPGEKRDCVN